MNSMSPTMNCLYFEVNGEAPVLAFLESLPEKAQAKIVRTIDLLEKKGTELLFTHFMEKMPGTSDLYELRIDFNKMCYRILFVIIGATAILLHGFVKKTPKAPLNEIKVAEARASQARADLAL